MNHLNIFISGFETSHYDEVHNVAFISADHFQEFFEKEGLLQDLIDKISLRCDVCGSFVVPATSLYPLIFDPRLILGDFYCREECQERLQQLEGLEDTFFALLKNLTEEMVDYDHLEDGWNISFTNPRTAPFSNLGGGLIDFPEWAEGPVRLRFEDVAFRFDAECSSCKALFS